MARRLSIERRRRSGSGDLGRCARGADPLVARTPDRRRPSDGHAGRGARPASDGWSDADDARAGGARRCPGRGVGGGHPGRGCRRHGRAWRKSRSRHRGTWGCARSSPPGSMVGMAREYAAPQSQAADAYRAVWDEAWRAVLPIEAVDAGYRLAAVLFDMLLLDEAGRVASGGRAAGGTDRRPGPRARPDPAGEVPARHGDVRLAHGHGRAAGAAEAEPDPHYRLRPPSDGCAVGWHDSAPASEEALGHADEARSLAAAAGCARPAAEMSRSRSRRYSHASTDAADARDALAKWDSVGRRSWVEAEWLRRRIGGPPHDHHRVCRRDAGAVLAGLRDEADALGLGFDALWTDLDMGRLLAPSDRAGVDRGLPAGGGTRRCGGGADHQAAGRPGPASARGTSVAARPDRGQAVRASASCPIGSARSRTSSLSAPRMRRSRRGCSCPARPSSTTSRMPSPSSACVHGRSWRRTCGRTAPGPGGHRLGHLPHEPLIGSPRP